MRGYILYSAWPYYYVVVQVETAVWTAADTIPGIVNKSVLLVYLSAFFFFERMVSKSFYEAACFRVRIFRITRSISLP